MKKEALESYSQKQGKAFISGPTIVSQNKVNSFLVALSAKISFSKLFLSSAPKKQSNSLQVDLFSKLASNSKLTSDKHKKCLYCSAKDYKLDFCSKKQTTVTPKGHGASATANTLAATSKKLSEK